MPKTLLAIGAHYDDCVFGIPGLMLQAVRKHYRVVIVSLIGDYSNWGPIGNRYSELIEKTAAISKEYGVEMRYLRFRTHQFDVNLETRRAVAEAVAEVQPDVGFLLWRDDTHDDHVVASRLAEIGLKYASPVLDKRPARPPREMYYFDNGPRHTIGFEPDTFVDITAEWERAIEWLGRFMALVRGEPYRSGRLDAAQQMKEALASYRGKTCGVKYAEAVRALGRRPVEIL
jgi:LmbE family N-acetylglucosaminyl deacetylase